MFFGTFVKSHLYEHVSFLSLWQNSWAKQLQGGKIYLPHGFRGFRPSELKECGEAKQLTSWWPGSTKRQWLCQKSLSFFPLWFSSRPLMYKMVLPTFRMVLPTFFFNPLWTTLTDTPRSVLYQSPRWFLIHSNWQCRLTITSPPPANLISRQLLKS